MLSVEVEMVDNSSVQYNTLFDASLLEYKTNIMWLFLARDVVKWPPREYPKKSGKGAWLY